MRETRVKEAGMIDRRRMMAGLGAGLLAGCAGGEAPDFAAAPEEEPRGGIGGTGIVGVLTGFGSLLVNGLAVGTGAETAAENAFGPVPLSSLTVGQALTIEAERRGAVLFARRIVVSDPLVGVLEAGERGLFVNGVPVIGETAPGLAGMRVSVSGLWRGGAVVASRIAPAAPGPDVIAGEIGSGAGGGVTVGGAAAALLIRLAPPPEGTFVTALGRFEDGRLLIRALDTGRFTGAAGPLERLSVEGYLEPAPAAPGFAVSGLGHSFDPAARLAGFTGRTLFEGGYDGDFRVETGLPLPEEPGARAAALARPGGRLGAR
ncbi:MAG: hypothetical protein ACE37J_07160 [Pikeienuella sp.]|uniref:hypothetical protein n=1 Tax=Pikeienuella sp. TaxID=2831957 RepID=UPI00391967CE